MKKTFLASCLLLMAATAASAQTFNVDELVGGDRDLAASGERAYDFDVPPMTPSPEGYKPFYISHYGRHGSRWCYSAAPYTRIQARLAEAKEKGLLTARGQEFHDQYMDFYLEPMINAGDLTELGRWQNERIAEVMYRDFPEVFTNGNKVLARASDSPRSIISMGSFCLGLQKHAPWLDITVRSLHTDMPYTSTRHSPRQIAKHYAGRPGLPGGETLEHFRVRKIDSESILSRLFTDTSFIGDAGAKAAFVMDLHDIWAGYHNYCDSDFMEDLFDRQARIDTWEVNNYISYTQASLNRFDHIVLLQEIEQLADEAIAGTRDVCLDLRYGHDHVVSAFFPLLGLYGSDRLPDKADDVKYWFQDYYTQMASNFQFTLYRSQDSDRILFKLLHNGVEVELRQLKAVAGPYYDWADFKAWCAQLYAEHPLI